MILVLYKIHNYKVSLSRNFPIYSVRLMVIILLFFILLLFSFSYYVVVLCSFKNSIVILLYAHLSPLQPVIISYVVKNGISKVAIEGFK